MMVHYDGHRESWDRSKTAPDPSTARDVAAERVDLGPAKYELGRRLFEIHFHASSWEDAAERAAALFADHAPAAPRLETGSGVSIDNGHMDISAEAERDALHARELALMAGALNAAEAELRAWKSQAAHRQRMKAGVRLAVAWLHARVLTMNDPHAQVVLRVAADHLGNALSRDPSHPEDAVIADALGMFKNAAEDLKADAARAREAIVAYLAAQDAWDRFEPTVSDDEVSWDHAIAEEQEGHRLRGAGATKGSGPVRGAKGGGGDEP